MKEQLVTPQNKCACQGVLGNFDTLKASAAKTLHDNSAADGTDFADALREVLEAHFEHATAILQRKFQENPLDVTAGFLLAQCFRLQHRYQEMIKVYEKLAMTHTLSHFMVFELALGYLNLGMIEKALPLLQKVSSEGQGEEAIAYHLAEAYFRAGELMNALSTLRTANQHHPDSRRIHDFLARLQEVGDP